MGAFAERRTAGVGNDGVSSGHKQQGFVEDSRLTLGSGRLFRCSRERGQGRKRIVSLMSSIDLHRASLVSPFDHAHVHPTTALLQPFSASAKIGQRLALCPSRDLPPSRLHRSSLFVHRILCTFIRSARPALPPLNGARSRATTSRNEICLPPLLRRSGRGGGRCKGCRGGVCTHC